MSFTAPSNLTFLIFLLLTLCFSTVTFSWYGELYLQSDIAKIKSLNYVPYLRSYTGAFFNSLLLAPTVGLLTRLELEITTLNSLYITFIALEQQHI